MYFTERTLLLNSNPEEKNDRSPYSFTRKWRFTSWRIKKKRPLFDVRAPMTREIMRSKDAQCNVLRNIIG